VAVAIGAALAVLGLQRATADRLALVFDHHHLRPRVLFYGPTSSVGRCAVRETDETTSDVLANTIDLDADGRADLRMTADLLGDHQTCEAKRFGFWWEKPRAECTDAIAHCASR